MGKNCGRSLGDRVGVLFFYFFLIFKKSFSYIYKKSLPYKKDAIIICLKLQHDKGALTT